MGMRGSIEVQAQEGNGMFTTGIRKAYFIQPLTLRTTIAKP